mmetsp:Transcript_23002/g.38862  ORF Transcript_23002/g.38862 Transcript_23002/m.38862 type:complete len:222 (+) Transcript_23002:527-1192(+)
MRSQRLGCIIAQDAMHAVIDELRDGGHRRGQNGQHLARRLHQHVGQPIAVAICRNPAWQNKEVRGAHRRNHLGLVTGTAPRDPITQTKGRGTRPHLCIQSTTADMDPMPIDVIGQKRERLQQPVKSFLLDQTTNRQHLERRLCVTRGPLGRFRKPLKIQTVIDQVHRGPLRQIVQMLGAKGRAGRPKCGPSSPPVQLFAQFPLGRGPDIFGMCRKRPWHTS